MNYNTTSHHNYTLCKLQQYREKNARKKCIRLTYYITDNRVLHSIGNGVWLTYKK